MNYKILTGTFLKEKIIQSLDAHWLVMDNKGQADTHHAWMLKILNFHNVFHV